MSLNLTKTKGETWTEYVDRLHDAKVVTSNQRNDWLSGSSIEVGGSIESIEKEAEQRTRTIPKIRNKILDGEQVEEVYEEKQTFLIQSFARKRTTFKVVIPAKESANPEGVNEVHFFRKETVPASAVEQDAMFDDYIESIKLKSSKRSTESWANYMGRLVTCGFVSECHVSEWENSENGVLVPLLLEHQYVEQSKGPRKFLKSGEVIEYTREVPCSTIKKLLLVVPAKGTLREEAELSGFIEVNSGEP